MDNKKYPKHVVDYAIDNKVSLEEAYKHYILHGLEVAREEDHPEGYPDVCIEEEEKFLAELEQKIKDQLSEDVMHDEKWWNKWHKKMDSISELEEELNIQKKIYDEITKEELDWVEAELEQVDKLYNEMYGKDV
tara:strand:+ start:305 stop:706 length:402 start_codon:yes stop_codon:yes gene_type:complete